MAKKKKTEAPTEPVEANSVSLPLETPNAVVEPSIESAETTLDADIDLDKDSDFAEGTVSSVRVVGIGASAGGLEAFKTFFAHMPPHSGMAFVLIQHLSHSHSSSLTQLVQRLTEMPVLQIDVPIDINANCVYITPPNRQISILHNQLIPLPANTEKDQELPIDFFFRELAMDREDQSICVILTGMGHDGSAGLKAVHSFGGLVMAQDPQSAQFNAMPESAIATGLVDSILPIEQMPAKLLDYARHALDASAQQVAQEVATPVEVLQQIFIAIRTKTGQDFSYYKQNTIGRRIKRRMSLLQISSLPKYIVLLQQSPDEVEKLYQELLIGVTSFFRDPDAFAILADRVIPDLIERHAATQAVLADQLVDSTIRIWVPGCSTGEEAYSIAILLQEYLEQNRQSVAFKIFATDIDKRAIERARSGRYPKQIEAHVSPNRLKRFFAKLDNAYVVSKSLRDKIVFAEQNVIKDPPFSKLDIISCRNLLIYWNSSLQKMILPLFHHSLKPEGVLVLGNSETVGDFTSLFEPIDRKWKIFRAKIPDSLVTSSTELQFPVRGFPQRISRSLAPISEEPQSPSLRHVAEQILFPRYLPSAVIITDRGEALHFYGRTGAYLEPALGDSTLNIFAMARPGLKPSLATAIHRVSRENELVVFENIRVQTNGHAQMVKLTVQPIAESIAGQAGLMLVTFEELPTSVDSVTFSRVVKEDGVENPRQVRTLEQELNDTRGFLQTTVEELETANEELQSTNEELQSANEELQSTNEELETSKEELQSLNEELVTVNAEYETKIEALSQSNNDLNNLLSSTDIASIFLDTDLNIKRFTSAATNIVNLIDSDVGRPLAHTVSMISDLSIVDSARGVLLTLVPMEKEVETTAGRWYLMKITPYRTQDNVIEGVVLTFIDLTEQKIKQAQLSKAESRIQAFAYNSADTINIYDVTKNEITFSNKKTFLGYPSNALLLSFNSLETTGAPIHPDDLAKVSDRWGKLLAKGHGPVEEIDFRAQHIDGHWEWLRSRITVLSRGDDGRLETILAVFSTITKQKRVENGLQKEKAFFQRIAETVPYALYIYEPFTDKTHFVNRQMSALIDIDSQDHAVNPFTHQSFSARIHPEDQEPLARLESKLMADMSGGLFEIKARIQGNKETDDAAWRWIRIQDKVFTRDEDGKTKRWLRMVEEISEPKQLKS